MFMWLHLCQNEQWTFYISVHAFEIDMKDDGAYILEYLQ